MASVAGIDCGTNSLRLLVIDEDSREQLIRTMKIVRLGEGVDATGKFAPEAIKRVENGLNEFVPIMKKYGVRAVRMVATSATRDVKNRGEFFDMTAKVLSAVVPGACAEVISGEEEAHLSFAGAISDFSTHDGPFAVVDLGGGSTELVTGDGGGTLWGEYSANIGCVRLTERFLHHQPPTIGEIASARTTAALALRTAAVHVPLRNVKTWVGVSGTFTTLSALIQGLDTYDETKIHLSTITFNELKVMTQKLLSMTAEERRSLGPMHSGRADVIGGGAIIVEELVNLFCEQTGLNKIVISEHDILDGIVAGLS